MSYNLASSSWNKAEIKSMRSVIRSGHFTMGKRTKEFEKKFARLHKRKYGVMVNSGSSANLLMIAANMFKLKNSLKPGDEIIVPAVSWSTSFFPLHQYGLKLVFVDVDINDYNIDPIQIKRAIGKKTRAILAVNLYGNPCKFSEIKKICKQKNIILLEDNCESLGAKYNNKLTGTFGLISTFSFFYSHHISTMEGGMVLTDNIELYQILLSLRAHGWTRQLPKNNLVFNKSVDPFYDLFNFVLPGYNVRPLELSAAIGLEQIKKIPYLIKQRRKNAEYFVKKMSSISKITIQKEIGESSWFCFGIILKNNRNKYLNDLRKAKIEFRPIVAGNFTKNPAIKFFNYKISGNLVNSNLIHKNGLSFGNSHLDLRKEIDLLYSVISKIN